MDGVPAIFRGFLFAGTLFLAGTAIVSADDVWMKNGSVLRGKVNSIDGDYVKLKTDITQRDELRIKQSSVATLVIEHSCEVVLKNGGSVVGPLEASLDDGFVTVCGNEIPIEDIREVHTKDAQVLLQEAAERRIFKTEIELGANLTGQRGNTDALTGGLHFMSETKNDTKSLKLSSSFSYGKTRSYGGTWAKSNDRFSTKIEWRDDFFDPCLWYFLSENGYDHTLNKRYSNYSAVGLGLNFLKEEKHKLSLRFGLSYRYEDLHDYTDSWSPGRKYDNTNVGGLDIGLSHEYRWGQSKIVTEITYAPSFDDFRGHYIINHETYYQTEIPDLKNMHFRIGVKNKYDSTNENPEQLDSYYYSMLVFRWK